MFDAWGESIQQLLYGSILGFAESAWAFMLSAFSVGELDSSWWVPVIGGTITTEVDGGETSVVEHPGMLNVMVRAMLPVLAIFVTLQIILSAARSSSAGFLRALGTAVFSVPATYALAGVMYLIISAVDRLTIWVLEAGAGSGDSQEVVMSALLNLFGLTYNPENDEVLLDENYEQWAMAANESEPGQVILPWIAMVIIWVLCLVMMGMMIFRTVVLMLMAVFLPIATFSMALEGAKAIFSKWLSMVVALIIAKPLAAAVVMTGMSLGATQDDWEKMVAGMIVVAVAAAAPIVLLGIIAFATGGASDQVERSAVSGGQSAMRAGRGAARSAARPAKRAAGMR